MTQRVRRAERKAKQRSGDYGFQMRRWRRLTDLTPLLKAMYPLSPADWPSEATVVVMGTVDTGPNAHRTERFLVRVKRCWGEAEAVRRALAKLTLRGRDLGCGWKQVVAVLPDGLPGIRSLAYREAPLFGMLKREDGR